MRKPVCLVIAMCTPWLWCAEKDQPKPNIESKKEPAVSEVRARLCKLVGQWEGVTKTWFEPDKLGDESKTKGSIKALLDGDCLLYEYEGTLMKQPMKGVALCGYDKASETFQMAWSDSAHTSSAIMLSQAKNAHDAKKIFVALGSYSAGAEKWGWRTEIVMPDDDHIVITHFNIPPSGAEYKGVETRYTRRK